jgi:hypothetical protein
MNARRVPYEACGRATGFSPWGLHITFKNFSLGAFFLFVKKNEGVENGVRERETNSRRIHLHHGGKIPKTRKGMGPPLCDLFSFWGFVFNE